MKCLQEKVAVVTGAGRGIGRAIARKLAFEGTRVIIADIDAATGERTAGELCAAGAICAAVETDASEPVAVERMVEETVRRFGHLDILVNNAGIGLTKLFLETTLEEWERVMRADLTGVFLCSQAAARVMVAQQSGAIINIASVSGQRGGVGRAAYGAAKAGVTLLTKVMAVELAPHGIRVNEIAPGPVLTEMSNQQHNEAVRRAYHDRIPMRRYGEQEEIADAAVFLASDESRYVNGHTLNVDGGFHAAGLMFDLAHGCAIAEPAGPPGRSSDRACGSSGNGPTSSLESSCAPPSKT